MNKVLGIIALFFVCLGTGLSQKQERQTVTFQEFIQMWDTVMFLSPDKTDTVLFVLPNKSGSVKATIILPSTGGTLPAAAGSGITINAVTGVISYTGNVVGNGYLRSNGDSLFFPNTNITGQSILEPNWNTHLSIGATKVRLYPGSGFTIYSTADELVDSLKVNYIIWSY